MKGTLICLTCGKACDKIATLCACGKPILHHVTERYGIDRALSVAPDVATFMAVDRVLHQAAAVHVLRPMAGEPAKNRLAKEARLFREHEGVGLFPSFLTAGRMADSGSVFTAVELVKGVTLAEACTKVRPAEIIDHFLQAAELIVRVHALGIIVLNLKPEHFRITPEGEMRLVDLRCAREFGAPCHGLGAKGFMAPEQGVKLEAASAAMDAYALAAILYYLFTGRLPYFVKRSSHEPAFDAPLTPASALNPVVPPELDAILARGLAVHPEERFADAAALRDALSTHYARKTRLDISPLTVPSVEEKTRPEKTVSALPGAKSEMAPSVHDMPYAIPPYVPPLSGRSDRLDWKFWVKLAASIIGFLFLGIMWLRACDRHVNGQPMYEAVPAAARETGESFIRVLSWPAAKVFVNGKLRSEGPSLDDVACPSGSASFRIISNTGKEHSFTTWLSPGRTYDIRTDLDNSTHSVQEAGR